MASLKTHSWETDFQKLNFLLISFQLSEEGQGGTIAVTQKEVSALSYFGDILLETCISDILFDL